MTFLRHSSFLDYSIQFLVLPNIKSLNQNQGIFCLEALFTCHEFKPTSHELWLLTIFEWYMDMEQLANKEGDFFTQRYHIICTYSASCCVLLCQAAVEFIHIGHGYLIRTAPTKHAWWILVVESHSPEAGNITSTKQSTENPCAPIGLLTDT